eukprot:6176497-Pleurochrysis_carterae.AAC.3
MSRCPGRGRTLHPVCSRYTHASGTGSPRKCAHRVDGPRPAAGSTRGPAAQRPGTGPAGRQP